MEALRQCYLSLGFNKQQTEKLIENCSTHSVELIKQKFNDYMSLLHINPNQLIKLINRDPHMLTRDVMADNPTSAKSKIKLYQEILNLEEQDVIKCVTSQPMILGLDCTGNDEKSVNGKLQSYQNILHITNINIVKKLMKKQPALLLLDCNGDDERSIKNKVKAYQQILKVDIERVTKMVISQPSLLTYDLVSADSKSVRGKIKAYQSLLQLDEATVIDMIIKQPALLSFDCTSNKATSVTNKIKKISEIITFEKCRELIINKPNLLNVPAKDFKKRYMLAVDIDEQERFFRDGYMTNQNKVWVRYCYINDRNRSLDDEHKFSYHGIYKSEKVFQKRFGVSSKTLMNQYILDNDAFEFITQKYQEIKQEADLKQQIAINGGVEK